MRLWPGLAVTVLPLALVGPAMAQEVYIGQIMVTAAPYCPAPEYLEANGATLQVDRYPELYALLGTHFGGDPPRTFRLPDLRGRVVVGAGAIPGGAFLIPGEAVALPPAVPPGPGAGLAMLTCIAVQGYYPVRE